MAETAAWHPSSRKHHSRACHNLYTYMAFGKKLHPPHRSAHAAFKRHCSGAHGKHYSGWVLSQVEAAPQQGILGISCSGVECSTMRRESPSGDQGTSTAAATAGPTYITHRPHGCHRRGAPDQADEPFFQLPLKRVTTLKPLLSDKLPVPCILSSFQSPVYTYPSAQLYVPLPCIFPCWKSPS